MLKAFVDDWIQLLRRVWEPNGSQGYEAFTMIWFSDWGVWGAEPLGPLMCCEAAPKIGHMDPNFQSILSIHQAFTKHSPSFSNHSYQIRIIFNQIIIKSYQFHINFNQIRIIFNQILSFLPKFWIKLQFDKFWKLQCKLAILIPKLEPNEVGDLSRDIFTARDT